MKDRITIKLEARDLIQSSRVSAIAVSAIVVIGVALLGMISTAFEYHGTITPEQFDYILNTGDFSALLIDPPISSPLQSFVPILVSLLTSVFYAGYYSYCLGIYRGEEMPYSSLLNGLGIVGQVIWCEILMGIKIFLWSMLFFFPGIIAAYRYRFSIYNLLTDPSLTASQAIALSCRQTRGMKMDLFVLDLSFLGWNLLSGLTLGILNIWVLPYATLSDIGYYAQAQERMGVTPDHNEHERRFPGDETPY